MTDQGVSDKPRAARWSATLGRADQLPPDGGSARFEAASRAVAVFNVGGVFYAVDDTCTHRPASLVLDGHVTGTTVTCGWHLSAFDLVTGANVEPPACDALRVYDLDIGEVVVATERGV